MRISISNKGHVSGIMNFLVLCDSFARDSNHLLWNTLFLFSIVIVFPAVDQIKSVSRYLV